ncbi:MAG: glycosyltransferase family 2 protein [Patescibacteria group bacterium]|nr:glycosyltransferase family 2 protein [Patescibacteria group bacterium]MCL5431552.1 glycosyltransferase family 2 protein [Patescibacteria group bacterium]
MKLSAIVFVFWPEEENYVAACLQTVSFADEIIVIDNGATAKTLAVCKEYTPKIFHTDSKNFSDHHNLGKQKATGDWLLYVDADERVSAGLADEIKSELAKPSAAAYELRRVNFFLGKKVRFGDRYPDYVTRLFQKDKLVGWKGEIHESSKVDGEIGRLSQPLYHLTHRDIYSMLAKTANFAEHEANLRLAAGHPQISGWRLLRIFATEMFNRLIKLQGVRGGTEGWIDGIFQSFSLFIAYVRLWELQRRLSLAETYKEIDKKIISGEL